MLAGYRDFCLARGQAPGTIRQRLEVLHLLWEEAIHDGLVKHNPVAGVLVKEPKPRVKQQAKKRVALTMAEGIKLVDAATVDELVAVVVGLDTGARIGDAFGMEAARVDLYEGKIEFWVEARTEVKEGSMTFTEMMELVHYATGRLVALQHEHLSEPPPQRMAPDWSI
jgi:integrase